MKKHSVFLGLIMFVLIGCSPFNKDKVLDYESELNTIVDLVDGHVDTVWFYSDDIPEMIKLDIDFIVKNLNKKILNI